MFITQNIHFHIVFSRHLSFKNKVHEHGRDSLPAAIIYN